MKKCTNTLFVLAEKGRFLNFLLDKMAADNLSLNTLFVRSEKGRFWRKYAEPVFANRPPTLSEKSGSCSITLYQGNMI